ncbi:putative udp-glucuronic acid epimerase [Pedobacter sp. BAL39]|uniref:NAD-dependent epimerase n=1 Tax=Pedobacter sp. BAL39 TaxID=391596 RepID=UPI0001559B90|nr:NAD-dependent epimerase [Pedobacter sp. BAL39]EDM38341.1 putative udp-glucuronic acid epimerase [Pedobacter sp. BAL39]
MKVLVTGTAGFIGFHVAKYLLERGDEVVGIDNINDYYDVSLKYRRLEETGITKGDIHYGELLQSSRYENYHFAKLDITDHGRLKKIFKGCHFDAVCHLAAQAGVRYSLSNPKAYVDANIVGFLNILECCRLHKTRHLVYASSSSVYGLNEQMPFSVEHHADHPVSLYAASKRSNELMAHSYSHLFGLPTTGLRFFTVYGPWGRPDMALFIFTKAMMEKQAIDIYNHGRMKRDFTYISDIVSGIVGTLDRPAKADPDWSGLLPNPSNSCVPYRLFNIGRGQSVSLMDFITEIEHNTGCEAIRNYLPLQSGDVAETWADISKIQEVMNYAPKVSVTEGVQHFVAWYKDFYGLNALKKKPSTGEQMTAIYPV